MMHKSLPVAGYQDQNEQRVSTVNSNKILEERVLRAIDLLSSEGIGDGRWLAIARTHIEIGFMALNRAVFQPRRVSLPEDEKSAAAPDWHAV